jgi:hypothetical protein
MRGIPVIVGGESRLGCVDSESRQEPWWWPVTLRDVADATALVGGLRGPFASASETGPIRLLRPTPRTLTRLRPACPFVGTPVPT